MKSGLLEFYKLIECPISTLGNSPELEKLNCKLELFLNITNKGKEKVVEILKIMREAYKEDNKFFILNIFFEFCITQKKLVNSSIGIYQKLADLKKNTNDSIQDKMQMVDIYRNIISDLFDPYLSLLIACVEYKEGEFTCFLNSNFKCKERSKYEYLNSRLKPTTLFEGYNPDVRNAITHTGTDGVTFRDKTILFKSIRRGISPQVTSISWSTNDLSSNILSLLSLIYAIDISIEIFGLEIRGIISSDRDLERKFLDQIITKEQRLSLMNKTDSIIHHISKSNISENDKIQFYANIYFLECNYRQIAVKNIGLKDDCLFVKIPFVQIDIDNDDELIYRLNTMMRYAIIAEPLFRFICNQIVVYEIDDDEKEQFKIVCSNKDLKAYGEERAGLLDLLNDSSVYFEMKKFIIEIDFEALEQMENTSLDRIFPRKKRE